MVEKINFSTIFFYTNMKNIIYSLLLFLSFSLTTNAQVSEVIKENDEEFEESKDPRLKNLHLQSFRNLETGEVDYDKVREVHSFIDNKISNYKKQGKVNAAIPYIEWEERGPNNFAGRIQKIMYDPNDPTYRKVWAGSNSVGLFYNNNIEDPNSSWVATNMFDGPIGIREITYDPTNTQHFYVSASGGIYKSTDAGQTWTLMNSSFSFSELLVISSSEIIACTSDGLKKSTNGGSTWVNILKPSANIGGSFIGIVSSNQNTVTAIEQATDGVIFVAFGCGQVFKSANGGTNWTNILAADNPSFGGNTLLTLAPNTNGTNQVLYILCAKTDGSGWLRKSVDAGANWSLKTSYPALVQFYDNLMLKVHPTDANIVFFGVTYLRRSINGGDTWSSINPSLAPTTQADWHDIHFKPSDPTKAIMSNDQGVSVWSNVNTPSITGNTQYKDFIASQAHWGAMRQVSNDNVFVAATQDQSSKVLNGLAVSSATNLNNNEGCWAKVDDDEPNLVLYTSMVSVNLWVKDLNTNTNLCVTCGSNPLPTGWTTYFGGTNNASRDYDSQTNTAYAAHVVDANVAGRVWFRKIVNVSPTNGAGKNQIIDFYIDGLFAKDGVSSIYGQDLLVYPLRIKLGKTPGTMFVSGYSNINSTTNPLVKLGGVLYKVSNMNDPNQANWVVTRIDPISSNISDTFRLMPESIAVGANDNELFITMWASTTLETLWYTNNGGTSWQKMKKMVGSTSTQTGLPANFGANYAIFNPLNYKQVILSTEYGIWTCDDITVPIPQWEITNAKFGKIPCRNIEIRPSDGTVMVATYGRGIFTAKLNTCQSNIVRTDVINGGVLNIPSSTYIRGTAGNTIQSNGNVKYDAKTYILLEPNFEVKKGGVFKAQIGGCN
jgi:hypothetical protein